MCGCAADERSNRRCRQRPRPRHTHNQLCQSHLWARKDMAALLKWRPCVRSGVPAPVARLERLAVVLELPWRAYADAWLVYGWM